MDASLPSFQNFQRNYSYKLFTKTAPATLKKWKLIGLRKSYIIVY